MSTMIDMSHLKQFMDEEQCECERLDLSYYCDECIEKQALQASELRFSDAGDKE